MTDTPPLTVALVDDDDDLRHATTQLLTLHGFAVTAYSDATTALAAIGADFVGVVVTDVRMPGMSGIELFRTLAARDAELPVILITGHGDVTMAVDAIKAGAWDFLTKPFDPEALVAAVSRAATARRLALENRRLRIAAETPGDDALIGDAPAIRRLRAMIPILADAALDLVIEGQVGTGREHFARLVHRAGRRARHRFLKIDCATVAPELVERDLFARSGAIARADRGTLFLDNLGMASADLQHRLARLAETRAVALDARDPDAVDIRIIAAMDEGARDTVSPALFHLLAGVPVRMPHSLSAPPTSRCSSPISRQSPRRSIVFPCPRLPTMPTALPRVTGRATCSNCRRPQSASASASKTRSGRMTSPPWTRYPPASTPSSAPRSLMR